jgi:hypothetical protein
MKTHKYFYIFGSSSTKYFVARHHCKGNLPLRFHGNTQQFHIFDSYIRSSTMPKEFIFALSWE